MNEISLISAETMEVLKENEVFGLISGMNILTMMWSEKPGYMSEVEG